MIGFVEFDEMGRVQRVEVKRKVNKVRSKWRGWHVLSKTHWSRDNTTWVR